MMKILVCVQQRKFSRRISLISSFIDLPDEKPRITGIKEKYQIGETLEALCTSWQSHPPANLTWFINEEKVKDVVRRKYFIKTIVVFV